MPMKSRNIVLKAITIVLFGLLIISFVIWGVGDIIRNPGQTRAVAEVGDVEIEQREFLRTLTREVNRLSARFGGRLEIEQARALGVVDQVLGQMIGRALFDQKADDLGMVVTEQQILRRIQQEPAFHNERGEFDRARFVQALQVSNLSEGEYLQALRRDIIRQQIAQSVTGGVSAPRQLAEELYRYRAERRIAQVLTIPNASIAEVPEPDEAALAAFHQEFSDKFMAPEHREVTVVELRSEDLAEEVAVPESELQAEFEARQDEFVTPERRAIEQMIFNDEAAARQAAEKLEQGGDFATVAQETTGQPPIELGAVERADLPPALADPAFALAQGTPSEPLQSALGWHILRVTEVMPRVEPSFEEARDELAQDLKMRKAIDSMISIANQLDDAIGGGSTLEEAAQRLDLPLQHFPAVDGQGRTPQGQPVEGLPPEPFLETAFATEAGTESLLTETDDGGYFVLRVDAVTPARVRPLEEVREQVAELWREAQRANRAREKAEALAEQLRAGGEFEAVAGAEGLTVETTEPLTRFDGDSPNSPARTLPSKLFQLSPGGIAVVNAPDKQLVAKLMEIVPANPAANETEVAGVREGLQAALQDDLLEQYVATLRDEYGVEINQRLVDDLLATF